MDPEPDFPDTFDSSSSPTFSIVDMDNEQFDPVSWRSDTSDTEGSASGSRPTTAESEAGPSTRRELQAGPNADDVDLAGVRLGKLECNVSDPQKENDRTKDAFVSYLVTTDTDFPTFQKSHVGVRRRFTDFVYLWKMLSREFPACAVPPLPDKHKMEYVRGDRFGNDFTFRRAHSLQRFLKRLTLHPVLRRQSVLMIFLESADWNAHMRLRPTRQVMPENNSVFDGLTDTFLNAFSKVHKPDRRFIEVNERANKLEEDLGHIEKIFSRVVRREGDLETDYADLSTQFQKIVPLEPNLDHPIHIFAEAVEATSQGMKDLKDHTDQNYLVSLRDMDAYINAMRALLKAREQKQLDYEALTDYLNKAAFDRDQLASAPANSSGGGAAGFLRGKMEDMRGVDHEQSRRERVRKLELRIDELTREAEEARKTTEAFDEEVVREVADFERIKTVEMRDTMGDLAIAHINFYQNQLQIWENMLKQAERED